MAKPKKNVVGYIIESPNGVYHLSENTLWFGSYATIFSDRRKARNAIERTKTYAAKQKYDWPWIYRSDIVPLRFENV